MDHQNLQNTTFLHFLHFFGQLDKEILTKIPKNHHFWPLRPRLGTPSNFFGRGRGPVHTELEGDGRFIQGFRFAFCVFRFSFFVFRFRFCFLFLFFVFRFAFLFFVGIRILSDHFSFCNTLCITLHLSRIRAVLTFQTNDERGINKMHDTIRRDGKARMAEPYHPDQTPLAKPAEVWGSRAIV